MIETAAQFMQLRSSDRPDEYRRAAHEAAPLSVWRAVIENHPEGRFWVAQNKTVPLEILQVLANDESVDVRCMVARKRKLPISLQLKLASDPNESVRHAVACNTKVCDEALELLANDDSNIVRDLAAGKL